MSWSRSGNSSSIEELNARNYKHFKGRKRSIGSQIKLRILEEEKANAAGSSDDAADMDTASGGARKFRMKRRNTNGEISRSRSPPQFYCKYTYHRFTG